MSVLEDFKNKNFWIAVLKLAAIFFVVFVFLSLLISNFQAVISGNFAVAIQEEWGNGKWKEDLTIKAAITFVYAVYMTSRRQNFEKDNS